MEELGFDPEILEIVVVIAAALQLLKAIPRVMAHKEILPLLALGLGLGLAYATQVPIIDGAMAAMIAAGGYDILKAPVGLLKPKQTVKVQAAKDLLGLAEDIAKDK